MPQVVSAGFSFFNDSTSLGMRGTVLGGAAGPEKKAPSFLPFSSLSGGVPGNIGWLSLEEIGYEDLVGPFLVSVGEDVGALQRLREEAKDIEHDKDGMLCRAVSGLVCVLRAGLAAETSIDLLSGSRQRRNYRSLGH